jgi:hypothetical protein
MPPRPLTAEELRAAAKLCEGDAGKAYPDACADVTRRIEEGSRSEPTR